MVRAGLALAALALLGTAAPAQEPPGGLDWFHGRWAGAGTVQGAPSEAALEVAPVLAGRFVELRYSFETKGERPFRFEGRGFYRADGDAWRGQWFDSTGATRPLTGTVHRLLADHAMGRRGDRAGPHHLSPRSRRRPASDRRGAAPRRPVAGLREPQYDP